MRNWERGKLMRTKPERGQGTAQREIKSKGDSEAELPGAAKKKKKKPTGAEEMRRHQDSGKESQGRTKRGTGRHSGSWREAANEARGG